MSDRQVVDNKPSLRTLAYVLRNREFWPAGFVWDYQACSHCALGLSKRLWGVSAKSDDLEEAFGLTYKDSEHIFINRDLMWIRERGGWVQPEDVADLIDAHLAAA